ncbi:MAG: hypothetical protein K9K30_01400 [Burkholderiaceae bacterium]|nr:hypothetical protein [Sulfuritalea sp.]MCF8173884.1 hypothetical protein [Burkholderiaceae bacterium]
MTITAQLTLGDGERSMTLSLCSVALAKLAETLIDHEDTAEALDWLSRHADSAVRKAIARKKCLPATAVRRLVADPAVEVTLELLRSIRARRALTGGEVISLCLRDPAVAESIACRYDNFELDGDAVANFLERHADSRVRIALAGNAFVPKPILRRLAQSDPDAGVRNDARQMLE